VAAVTLNLEYAGRSYPPSDPYEVGVEKIREFATAIGDDNPAYHDVAAARALGHRSLVAPPTFVFTVAFAATQVAVGDPGLGLDYTRVVHGDQRFSYVRPLVAGDRIQVTTTLESVRSVAGNDMVTARCDVTDESGAPVVSTWSMLVARGTAS
jgi:acyl dehydratase